MNKDTIITIKHSHDNKWLVKCAMHYATLYQYVNETDVNLCIDYLLNKNRKMYENVEYTFPQLCEQI